MFISRATTKSNKNKFIYLSLSRAAYECETDKAFNIIKILKYAYGSNICEGKASGIYEINFCQKKSIKKIRCIEMCNAN